MGSEMTILYAGILLGALGVIFGAVLTFANKKFHVEVDERVAQVRECLGGANCGACGYPGCDGFAAAVVKGEAPINGCAPAGEKGAKAIGKIMGQEAVVGEKLVCRVLCQGAAGIAKDRYQYDGYQSCSTAAGLAGGPKDCRFACLGLGDCAAACPHDAIVIRDGLAHVIEEKCVACGLCTNTCPKGLIYILPYSEPVRVLCSNKEKGAMVRKECTIGCIACGLCVKNCPVDAITIENNLAYIDQDECIGCLACKTVCPVKVIIESGHVF